MHYILEILRKLCNIILSAMLLMMPFAYISATLPIRCCALPDWPRDVITIKPTPCSLPPFIICIWSLHEFWWQLLLPWPVVSWKADPVTFPWNRLSYLSLICSIASLETTSQHQKYVHLSITWRQNISVLYSLDIFKNFFIASYKYFEKSVLLKSLTVCPLPTFFGIVIIWYKYRHCGSSV